MNRHQLARYQAGRVQRLTAETKRADDCASALPCPLYSHDATWQSQFRRGWCSVSMVDIQAERLKLRAGRTVHPAPSIARQSINEIHHMLRRHL
ncbi:hypothetical protein FM038_017280 [Shewanella eurypsychrophilus]|uniref:Transposase n=1 Tax=Shewanella eurypsychrophilus TaxID=2593656 RepID=A0ABX6V8K2_9GAMM|nr:MULTISPECIES: hypothetical protein [Shewanella]QFU23750.1 hypothetical protein FS418_19060 [Shewanella sp. YLB-09]QPG58973.1 hypothetical protein FM038_017280 [Shewanella eurypsychrophilus]